jgi:hypothetical protein
LKRKWTNAGTGSIAAAAVPRYHRPVRYLVVLLGLFVVTGCAEAVEGPRVVTYTPDRFYVRHIPWRDSRASVDQLAGSICEQTGRGAILEEADQYAWLDIRYATYRCTPDAPAATSG